MKTSENVYQRSLSQIATAKRQKLKEPTVITYSLQSIMCRRFAEGHSKVSDSASRTNGIVFTSVCTPLVLSSENRYGVY